VANEFEIVRGTTETLNVTVVNQAGAPVDLTGYTSISLYADKALNATSPTLTKSASSVTPSSGSVSFAFIPTDTASLATGEYLAELHVVITANVTEYRTIQPFIFRILQRVKL
jgi:hypothetical protein